MRFVLAAVAALTLVACNQSSGAPDAPAASTTFPDLFSASYRADASIRGDDGVVVPVVTYRAGRKQRMEFSTNGASTIMLSDLETNEAFVISEASGRRMAMRVSLDDAALRDAMAEWEQGRARTVVGPCAGAGQVGMEWSLTPTELDPALRTTCVTSDGIILKSTKDGQVVWETTSVTRGAQDPALFTAPDGVQVVDMSALGAQMRGAMERAKAGQ